MHTPVDSQTPITKKQGYYTLILVAISHSVSHMYAALMTILYPSIMAEFGFGYTQLGFMVGLGNTLQSLMQGVYVFIMRRIYRKVLLASGNFLLALCVGLMTLTSGLVPFFIVQVLARVSTSSQDPVGNSFVAEDFGKKLRGTAFAVNFAGGNVGTLIVPVLGTIGLATFGWRTTLLIFALLAFIAGLLILTIQEKPLTEEKKATARGKIIWSAGKDWIEPLKDKNIRHVILGATVAAGGRGIGVVMIYIPLYFQQELHLKSVDYATLFTIMMVASVVGPLIVGRISDSVGRKWTAMATYTLTALATASLFFAGKNMAYLMVAVAFLGIVAFAQSSQIQALIADVSSREKRDMAYSVFFTITYLAGGIWSVILGFTVDRLGFTGALVLMSLSCIAGAFSLIQVRVKI
ncbi:MAG TPA: hypothetical protein DEF89_15470 [Desulfosporosinus sp.]|nr:hypothetical protein [Desulfosporosinus sp.]